MDSTEYKKFLHRTGHFWHPGFPNLHNVTSDNLNSIDLKDSIIQQATASFQMADASFDDISQLPVERGGHARAIIPDGDIGPVTEQMSQVVRCPIPDWLPPNGVTFPEFSSDPETQTEMESIVESMRENATGRGSWPVPGCDLERSNRANEHSVRINIDTTKASSHQLSILNEVLKLVEACEAEMGQSVRHIINGNPQEAEHDIRFEFIAGGVIGFNYFPQAGTCDQVVKGRLDNSWNKPVLITATLFIHEYKGHGDGLRHTNGGIMNPSIRNINPLSWKGDPHEKTKSRYFGGEPIESIPTTPTDPTNNLPDNFKVNVPSREVQKSLREAGYIIIPRPEF